MQRYQCHTVVEAAKIMSLCGNGNGTTTFEFEAPVAPVTVDTVFMNRTRITLDDLGYFVHDADGSESWSPTVAFEDGYTLVVLVGFTADQLRDLMAIGTADPGTVEDIHNRWFHQKVADGWHFGNTATAANVSSYLRVFHELAPEQQGLLVHELSEVARVPEGLQGD